MDEGFRAEDGPVHVALRGEMRHGIGLPCRERPLDRRPVADVGPEEKVPFAAMCTRDVVEALEVSRLRQGVQVDDTPVEIWPRKELPDEIGSDETSPAGDEHRFEAPHFLPSRIPPGLEPVDEQCDAGLQGRLGPPAEVAFELGDIRFRGSYEIGRAHV